ncbi:MAG: OadG family protein [Firmicutes bacterium]|nr:OadG family protein [Bacillota bacterium]
MTISEALSEGAQTAVIGLGTVFAVLIILMVILYIMRVIFYKDPNKNKTVPAAPAEPAEPVAPVNAEDDMDESELIAVLTAAVAASLNTSTYNLQIKSYRRIDGTKSPWQKAGIRETINSRF